jgi:RNA ligase (TIGR02306 family)
MTKLATIEQIHSVQKHPNEEVEKLEVAKIKEWPVVVQKGQFKDGDLVVFIQIDSIVPKENPYFAFMERQKYRVWSAKFKGAPSQGLVCPLSILPEFTIMGEMASVKTYAYNDGKTIDSLKFCQIGDDVSAILGITKYEKPLDATICGDAKGGFPSHLVSITDEDNLLNNPECLKELYGERCYATLKADGSSMTIINDNGEIRVCSRRWEQKEGTGLWKIADAYDLPNKLKASGLPIAIQAEACGGKIQGNPLGLNKPAMYVFNIKDVSTGKWYGWNEIKETCKQLGIPHVNPILENFLWGDEWLDIKMPQSLANCSVYLTDAGKTVQGEGIVFRPMVPKYSPTLGKSLSVKVLNQNYKQ